MIRITTLFHTAALGLIMSALTAQFANTQVVTTQAAKTSTIPISYLPFNITAPGTYVFTGNLTSTVTEGGGINTGAVNISTAIAGRVVVDLKGYTINGPGSLSRGITIGAISWNLPSIYPITIENGTITNVELGIITPSQANLSHMVIKDLAFNITSTGNAVGYGILINDVSSSLISNCTINGVTYGIADSGSCWR
jgi:hypothetical protein